jgi:RHS repeat-associated protein
VQDDGSLTTDYLASYYSADEKVSLVTRHRGFASQSDDSQPGARGVWEQTRYDALGRRVASYAQRGPACPVSESECASAIERTVWDGAQMLYEIRATPGLSYVDTPSSGTLGAYGRVLYTQGGGIDQPLAVTRLGLEGQPAAVTLSLHAGWQGEVVGATLTSGAPQAGCSGSSGCPQVAWAGGRLTVDGVRPNVPANPAWWGSLTTASGTASGLTYQRNRFYDPTTGQFTQADPIGLAGGHNLYAFAGGDPVNFSDPFGLMRCPPDCSPSQLWENAKQFGRDVADMSASDWKQAFKGAASLFSAGDGGLMMGPAASIPTAVVSRARYPAAAANIESSQASGKASVVTIDRTRAVAQRAEALRGWPTKKGLDRDEYPGAMFREGGAGASVRYIPPSDNRGAGACIAAQCRALPDGTQVHIKVVPD